MEKTAEGMSATYWLYIDSSELQKYEVYGHYIFLLLIVLFHHLNES